MDFTPFSKIPRLNRAISITEKLDGTNAQLAIRALHPAEDDPDDSTLAVHNGFALRAGSRNRFLSRAADNFGFARWALDNAPTLIADLGEGLHFGEWYGAGVNAAYGGKPRALALFNTKRWEGMQFTTPGLEVVPRLYEGPWFMSDVFMPDAALDYLAQFGSLAAPGQPAEGIVIYHTAANVLFKATIQHDESPKSAAPPFFNNLPLKPLGAPHVQAAA